MCKSFRDKNIEVLLMHEPIDEWVVGHLPEFESKKVKSVLNADLKEEAKLDQSDKHDSPLNEEQKKENKTLQDFRKLRKKEEIP